jgi:hypothetical protein
MDGNGCGGDVLKADFYFNFFDQKKDQDGPLSYFTIF